MLFGLIGGEATVYVSERESAIPGATRLSAGLSQALNDLALLLRKRGQLVEAESLLNGVRRAPEAGKDSRRTPRRWAPFVSEFHFQPFQSIVPYLVIL